MEFYCKNKFIYWKVKGRYNLFLYIVCCFRNTFLPAGRKVFYRNIVEWSRLRQKPNPCTPSPSSYIQGCRVDAQVGSSACVAHAKKSMSKMSGGSAGPRTAIVFLTFHSFSSFLEHFMPGKHAESLTMFGPRTVQTISGKIQSLKLLH